MQELTLLHNGIKTSCCAPVRDGDRYVYTFTAADIDSGVLEISLFEALAGDEGYFAIPYVNANFLTKFTARPDVDHVAREGLLMPMVGVRLNGEAFLMIFEGMPYDLRTRITVKDSLYRLSVVYDLDSISLYEPIKLAVYPLGDVDYSAMARRYRRYVSEKRSLVPLAQRSEPHMRYALEGMPVIRIRMGWKPVPTPIDEQTIATEPPMHVACTFADVEALIDEMRAQGIERAEICLVGWNVRGHDGRWPQAFPVEEAFGGEAGLKKLIAHAQSAGYRIVCHTNASDAYSIADSFNEEALIRKKNGAISVNGESWSGGRCYHLCPTPSFKNHQAPMLDSLKDLGFSGFHYIDVISVVAPRCCYHPEHPLNAADYVSEINRMLAYAKKNFGGASSEGCFDFCAGNLDFGLYAGFNVLDNSIPVADETIPLLQLVYHGYMLSNASAETINYMRKPARNRLKAYEYGSIPAVYFNSRFVGGDRRNWMGDDDMLFDTPELMKENVSRLKAEMDAYAAFAPRQLAFMDRHEKLSEGLFRITYSDGWRVIVNYNDTDTECEGIRVPANAFVQLPPKEADI